MRERQRWEKETGKSTGLRDAVRIRPRGTQHIDRQTDRQTGTDAAPLGILSMLWMVPAATWLSASMSSCCPWCCLQGPGGEVGRDVGKPWSSPGCVG